MGSEVNNLLDPEHDWIISNSQVEYEMADIEGGPRPPHVEPPSIPIGEIPSFPLVLPSLDISSLDKILASSEFKTGLRVVKITANIVSNKFAGIKLFVGDEKKESRLYALLCTLLQIIIDKVKGWKTT